MLQKGFGSLIFILLIAIILISVVGGWYFTNKTNTTNHKQPSEVDSKLTIPKSVNLFLESLTEGNQRLPVIVIKAFAGPNSCYHASDLKIKQEPNGDKLTVNILGYQDLGNVIEIGQVCIEMIVESRAKIKLDRSWLKENNNKEIVFLLNGQENSYKANYQQYKFSLNSIKTTNVLPEGDDPLEIILPTDVNNDLMDFSIVILQFNEGADVKAFAKKYNIPFEKIDGPSSAGTYVIPVLEDKGLLSTIEIFEKDPMVKSAKPSIKATIF